MKIFYTTGFILVGVLLQTQAELDQEKEIHFHCDVPDEWLFRSNGTQNIFPGELWTEGIVKYKLDKTLTENDKREVQRAFDDIQSKTCIRFEKKGRLDFDYTSIEMSDRVCGLAEVCMVGGPQFAQFGQNCRDWNTMVHELCHNLCLGHEHTRKDRDEFLSYERCRNSNEIPVKDTENDLRGSLYDYASQMHYQCGQCRLGGWPKQPEASKCGRDITGGLSVLDADKLNDLYNCGGCNGHRWKPIDALSDTDRQNMQKFGETETGEPLYACRGAIGGEIAIGKYSAETGICYLPFGGVENEFTNLAQVYTVPAALTKAGELKQPTYKVVNVSAVLSDKVKADVPIRSGRTASGVTGFIAVANIEFEGRRELSIGKVFEEDMTIAYFPFSGQELQIIDSFSIVTCAV